MLSDVNLNIRFLIIYLNYRVFFFIFCKVRIVFSPQLMHCLFNSLAQNTNYLYAATKQTVRMKKHFLSLYSIKLSSTERNSTQRRLLNLTDNIS